MANFVVALDPNPDRRSQFIHTIASRIAPLEGLNVQQCQADDCSVIWAANPQAPISTVSDAEGMAVVWGDAIAPDSSARTSACQLRNLWSGDDYSRYPAFDGYYSAVTYHRDRGLAVGADLLGTFPIYYYADGQITLVGSSPELFQYHPRFTTELNPTGLIGILLTNGLVGGQTLWQSVLRLQEGHLLVAKPAQLPQEIQQYQVPEEEPGTAGSYAGLTFEEQIEILFAALDRAVARHTAPNEKHCLLLSGGLDSRTLAGILQRQNLDTIALTKGQKSDLEMGCATPVARQLGFEHICLKSPLSQFQQTFQTMMQWEHLAGGANSFTNWALAPELSNRVTRVVSGYSLDAVLGGPVARRLFLKQVPFETFFTRWVNNWGIAPEVLKELGNSSLFGDLISERLSYMKACYENYAPNSFRQALRFELHHRQRFHIGMNAWRLSFGAWPVLPFLDRHLLATASAIPATTLDARRAQKSILCRFFPELAQLPLDRNSYNTEPLQPSPLRQRLSMLYAGQRLWWRVQKKLGYDRRYYYRIFDINHAGWQTVRRQAEPYRNRTRSLFNHNVFDRLVPPPSVPISNLRNPIADVSQIKALLGFLLWHAEHH